jgi:apolipoprotein N-acyltransferase
MLETAALVWASGAFIAFVLWCGFALHNGSDAFGIVIGIPLVALWPLTVPVALVACWLEARREARLEAEASAYVDERRDSIRRGARRSGARFTG